MSTCKDEFVFIHYAEDESNKRLFVDYEFKTHLSYQEIELHFESILCIPE